MIHAVGEADVAGAAEAGGGDDEEVLLLGPLTEGIRILDGGLHEKVEGTLRLYAVEADAGERAVEQIPVPAIGIDVAGVSDAVGNHLLHEAGRADIAKGSAGAADGVVNIFTVRRFIRYQNVADALARQGEGLTEGVADNGILIVLRHIGRQAVAVDNLPVGLIGDEIDGMTVCIGLFCQQSGQLLQGGLAVNGTGGIVGRIHDDGLGMGTQALRQRFKIDLETRQVRRHDDRLGTGIPDEYRILREEGREHQEFILRRGRQGPQGDGEGSRCTAGHVNVVGPKSRAVGLVQIIHDGLTGFLVALGGGIAVECGGGEFLQQLLQGIVYHCRCGHRGIAERKVINIFGTDHSSPLLAVFEKLTDGGTAAAETVHFFRNEHSGISFGFFCSL